MQNFACKKDCLLRAILDKITRRILFNCELIADLLDLQHNEPERLYEVVTKLQVVPGTWKMTASQMEESNTSQTPISPSQMTKLMMTTKKLRSKSIKHHATPDTQHPILRSVSCNGQKPVPFQDRKKR